MPMTEIEKLNVKIGYMEKEIEKLDAECIEWAGRHSDEQEKAWELEDKVKDLRNRLRKQTARINKVNKALDNSIKAWEEIDEDGVMYLTCDIIDDLKAIKAALE